MRSFDFAGRDLTGDRACFIEGDLVDILPAGTRRNYGDPTVVHAHFPDCDRYVIHVSMGVFGGVPGAAAKNSYLFPPLNGTGRTLSGELCNGVEAI